MRRRTYQPIRPLFGNGWRLGVIENHVARASTEIEIEIACALLNDIAPKAEWFALKCEEYQRRAHKAEVELIRLRGEMKL